MGEMLTTKQVATFLTVNEKMVYPDAQPFPVTKRLTPKSYLYMAIVLPVGNH